MTLRFNFWCPPGNDARGRIYIQGLPCAAKVWLQRGRNDKLQVASDDMSEVPDDVMEVILKDLRESGLLSGSDKEPSFDAIAIAARGAAKGRPNPGRPAPGSFPVRPAQAAASHDLDITSIANITQPIHIQVDHREPPQIVELLRHAPNTTVEVCALELGDYLIDGRILVERKSVADFEASVIDEDKRLFNQSERMKHQPELLAVLILEGDVFGRRQRMSVQQISGAITFLGMIQGMNVINSLDSTHTAYLLVKMGQHAGSGLGYELGLRSRKPKALLSARSYVLEGVPGVSAGLAKLLLAHFGSIAGIAVATEAELMGVLGIGQKRAAQIREVLS
jgi:ERCC4-type nuclease